LITSAEHEKDADQQAYRGDQYHRFWQAQAGSSKGAPMQPVATQRP
jgi:hypothetical protein